MSGIFSNGTISNLLERAVAAVLEQLASIASGAGANLVSFLSPLVGATPLTVADALGGFVSVRYFGAKGDGTNDMAAVLAARAASKHLYFPRVNGADTTYMLGAFAAGALDGAIVRADRGVTLSFESNAPYSLYKNIVFDTDVQVFFRDIGRRYVFPKTPSDYKKEALPMVSQVLSRTRTALDCTSALEVAARSVAWPGGDVFDDEAVTRTADALAFAGVDERFRGAFVELGPYETASAYFDSGVAPGPIGVIVRGTLGYSVIYGTGGASNYYTAQKPAGQPLVGNAQDFAWPELGQGRYASFHAENSVWSVSRIAAGRVIIKLNGKALTRPDLTGLGDVVEVGFVSFNSAPFSVSGLTVERRTDAIIGAQVLTEVRIFGDSTAEKFPGSWDSYIEQMIDGVAGLTLGAVTNFAVAGTSLEQAFARMQEVGFGNAYHVVVCSSTNNAQGGQSPAEYAALMAQVVDYIIAQGRKPLLVLPWMWYTQAQSGGSGQPAANYAYAAPLRMAMERIGFDKNCLVVKTTEELPNPDPAYIDSSDDPLLRDNIHQDVYGYQLYARAIAQAIIDDYCALPDSVQTAMAPHSFINGTTSAGNARCTVDKSGLGVAGGTITVTGAEDDREVIQLPRWCASSVDMEFLALAFSAGGATNLGTCYLAYDASTRRLRLRGAPVGTAVLTIATTMFKVA